MLGWLGLASVLALVAVVGGLSAHKVAMVPFAVIGATCPLWVVELAMRSPTGVLRPADLAVRAGSIGVWYLAVGVGLCAMRRSLDEP